MNNSKIDIEEDLIYEALVTTINENKNTHTKAFGIKFHDRFIELNLYPNNTLSNIENDPYFLVQITDNPLTFTKAVLDKLTSDDYIDDKILKTANIVFELKVDSIKTFNVFDKFGVNTKTRITSRILDTKIYSNKPYLINRATNQIIDLLIDYTRINFFDTRQLEDFFSKIKKCDSYLENDGNSLHRTSLDLIRKAVNYEY